MLVITPELWFHDRRTTKVSTPEAMAVVAVIRYLAHVQGFRNPTLL
jgi:hypothetical protein